jgi:hypothetical protein
MLSIAIAARIVRVRLTRRACELDAGDGDYALLRGAPPANMIMTATMRSSRIMAWTSVAERPSHPAGASRQLG